MIKKGKITSKFDIQLTAIGSGEVTSVVANESANLKTDLTYKDICKINSGIFPEGDWAIRGPTCEEYHIYKGSFFRTSESGMIGKYNPSFGTINPYDVYMFFSYELIGCAIEKYDGRLNAYGRKAKKAKEDAPPPDPDADIESCDTFVSVLLVGCPEGTKPTDDLTQNIIVPGGFSNDVEFKYAIESGKEFTSDKGLFVYGTGGDEYSNYSIFTVELTSTRTIEIEQNYGDL